MATQTIEFRSPPSQTVTLRLFVQGSDTQVASALATEATNRKGTYTAAFTDVPAGEYQVIATIGTSPIVPVASGFVTLTLTTATFYPYVKVELITAPSLDLTPVLNRLPDQLVNGRIKADATLVADQAVNVTKVGGTSVSGPNDLKADVTQIQTDVGTLLTRIPAPLFAGITSLAKWFGLLAGKTADAGALAELQATTAGASFSNTTDSLEAIRDRGDAAWVGGLGSGDYQLTLTISDGTNGVSGARVSLVGTGLGATTGTSGVIRFNVSGLTTYSVRVAPPGNFQSPADTSVVVGTANVSQTITLTANPAINPSAAPKCNVALPVTDGAGTALTGAKVAIEFIRFESGATPSSVVIPPVPELTSSAGVVTVPLLRFGRYRATYSYQNGIKDFEFVVPDSGSATIVEQV